MSVLPVGKRLAERALCGAIGKPHRMRGRSLILAYHNVIPDDTLSTGDRSLHLRLGALERQLDLIERHCHVAPLMDLLNGPPFASRPTVAITFDDAYQGAVEFGLPAVAMRGFTSTLFVAPALLGARSFWWDEMASSNDGLSVPVRARALDEQEGRQELLAGNASAGGARADLPESYACATADQVVALRRLPGVQFGAHSWGHPNLTRISHDELASELSRPLRWLSEVGLPAVPVLAYPYGLRSPAVVDGVERAGYSSALLVDGGWVGRGARDPWGIPRYNVPAGLSDQGFLLRLSGLFCD